MQWHKFDFEPDALGESPFWHPQEHCLYWVDIAGKAICRASLHSTRAERWPMPSEPGCIAPMQNGGLVIALRHGVFKAPSWGAELQHVATLPYDVKTVRANDGKCDALGRFWVGTLDETKTRQSGALYAIECAAGSTAVSCKISHATTSNGLEWSPDNTTIYWADTATHAVLACDFDIQTSNFKNQRTFVQFAPKPAQWIAGQSGYYGRPDGAAVDEQGNYYVAMYEGGHIAKFATDGTLLARLEVPLMCPTMVCFGGEDMRTLFVTSARQGRSESELNMHPLSGCVLYTHMDAAGLPVNYFKPA